MITEQGYARLKGVLRRRKLPIIAVAVGALAISAAVIGKIERRYKAAAVVRALESQPAKEYVAPTVGEPVGERLKTLRLSVMSRPILNQVAKEQGIASGGNLDAAVDEMRSRMDVKVEGEDTFLLTYEDADPGRAQTVVNAVAQKFMDQQVKRRGQMASATEKALADEAAYLKPELDKLEKQVRDFKLAHYGSLPEQQEQNLRTADQTTMEINIQATNLDLENERRRQLIAASMSPLRHQEDQLTSQLNEVRTKYLPEHPEVKRVQAELDRVHKARVGEERELRQKMKENNPELVALDNEIQRTSSTLGGLHGRLNEVRGRLLATAKNGQELARLQADYDTYAQKYQAVMGRLREAELASRIEAGLAGLRYELVEGAALPTTAAKPNRPLLAGAAVLLSLALGLGVGFALDRGDTKIYAPSELAALGRPLEVLAVVPDITAAHARDSKGRGDYRKEMN